MDGTVWGVVVLAALVGEGWLLWQSLSQQGRLLLRLEAIETRPGEAGLDRRLRPRSVSWPRTSACRTSLAIRSSSTLLLFWRPDCGFCQRMLGDLKA